jgi:hypothetical protein
LKKESLFLTQLNSLLDDQKVTLGEIAEKLKSKGLIFLTLFCVLPFMQPIPIPGLSSLLGFIIAMQGLGLMISGKPLLTKKMADKEISFEMMQKFVHYGHKMFPWISWLFSSHVSQAVHTKPMKLLCGFLIIGLAGFLSLPLPIPGSNFLPAIGIFFISLGLLEDDLLVVWIGILYAVLFGWLLSLSYHLIASELSQYSFF